MSITVKASVNRSLKETWDYFNKPEHILNWYTASPDWSCPKVENDLKTGGRFIFRMEARDGSFGFDFEGVYDEIIPEKKIAYTLADGRKVTLTFEQVNDTQTDITETFDPEKVNSEDMQKAGWQSILDRFKQYIEAT